MIKSSVQQQILLLSDIPVCYKLNQEIVKQICEKYIMGMPDFFKIGGLIKFFWKHGILAF